jgi:hypothetical protein
MKLSDALFRGAAAGLMVLSVAGCSVPVDNTPPPPVTSVDTSQDANNFVNQFAGLPNGVYRITIDGTAYGASGEVPCVAVKTWGGSYHGGPALGLSCNWNAAPPRAPATGPGSGDHLVPSMGIAPH